MPIKWSPLMVNEAMDMVEEYVNQAVEPLEQARIVASEARNILNLPQYVDQYLVRIIGEIDRAIGGSQSMTGQLDLFDGVKLAEPEPTTTVRLGRKTVQIPLRKKRREAIKRLMEILEELEGKDIYIGSYDAGLHSS